MQWELFRRPAGALDVTPRLRGSLVYPLTTTTSGAVRGARECDGGGLYLGVSKDIIAVILFYKLF